MVRRQQITYGTLCAKEETLPFYDKLFRVLSDADSAHYITYAKRPARGERDPMVRVRGQHLEQKYFFEVAVSLHTSDSGDIEEECAESISITFIYACDHVQASDPNLPIPPGVMEMMERVPFLTREGALRKPAAMPA